LKIIKATSQLDALHLPVSFVDNLVWLALARPLIIIFAATDQMAFALRAFLFKVRNAQVIFLFCSVGTATNMRRAN
jgi:hypothetical protein